MVVSWPLFILKFMAHLTAGMEAAASGGQLPAAVPCALCGGGAQLPHMNCANLDCNRLFLACGACKARPPTCPDECGRRSCVSFYSCLESALSTCFCKL